MACDFSAPAPLPSFPCWPYTMVIPKFYWDAESPEQRIKYLCMLYDKLAAYVNALRDDIYADGGLYDVVVEILNQLPDLVKEDVDTVINEMISTGEFAEIVQEAITKLTVELTGRMDAMELAYVRWYDTVAAMLADSNLKAGMIAHTNGYNSRGDDGDAFYVITTEGTPEPGYSLQTNNGLIANLATNGEVRPQQFGAVGNGTADETAVFQSIMASSADSIEIRKGSFVLTNLLVTKGISMHSGASLKYGGEPVGEWLTVTGSGLEFGNLYFDVENKRPHHALLVTGSNNYFNRITVENYAYDGSSDSALSAICFEGSYNTVDTVKADNFTQLASGNESFPQVVALLDPQNGVCNGCKIGKLYANNIRAGIVAANSGTVEIGDVMGTDVEDNGVYLVRGCNATVNSISIFGGNECIAIITDNDELTGDERTSAMIGSIRGENVDILFRFKNVSHVSIANIAGFGTINNAIYCDQNNTESGNIKIGSLHLDAETAYPFYMPSARGVCNSLAIDNADLTVSIRDNSAGVVSLNSFMDCSVVQQMYIGAMNILVKDTNGVVADNSVVRMRLNGTIYPGKIGEIAFQARNGNNESKTMQFRIEGALNGFNRITNGTCSGTNVNYDSDPALQYRGRLYAQSAPTAGTWNIGDVVYNARPFVNNYLCWICTEAGTPGTWKSVAIS